MEIKLNPEYFIALTLYFLLTFGLFLIYNKIYFLLGKKFKLGKTIPIHEWGTFYELHKEKVGTLTMAWTPVIATIGTTIVFSRLIALTGLIETSLLNRGQVYLPLFTLISFGIIGFIDDYINIKHPKRAGLLMHEKTILLLIISILWALWFYFKLGITGFSVPAFGFINLGFFFPLLFIFIIFATSNAVNITDGLDGLAGWLLAIAFCALGVITLFKGLLMLSIFCMIMVAGLIGFLWFNSPPGRCMMGDTGSLAFGGVLAVITMMTDTLFVLPIIGWVFFFEEATSFIQIFFRKMKWKKPFKIAPYHHHLEATWWQKYEITIKFWLIGIVCATMGILVAQILLIG